MGYPIHSNIFSANPRDLVGISQFPIQVTVLYSPGDHIFSNAFRELFLELDKITGNEVVFFALLDPPDDWRQIAEKRSSWLNYWRQKPLGFDANDRMLIEEISQCFGIEWNELPAIVVSTNLWSAEFVTSKTSPDHIKSQLDELTQLAKRRRDTHDLDNGYILETLQDKFGFAVRYQPANEDIRRRFSQFYDILSLNLNDKYDQLKQVTQYWNDTYFRIIRASRTLITRLSEPLQNATPINFSGADGLLRLLAGRLVPFTAKSEKLRGNNERLFLNENFDFQISQFISELQGRNDILNALDDESFTMINRSLRIGRFLDSPEALNPIIRRNDNKILDEFGPAGQGLWKTFEREINMSIVQAFRSSRTIEMPNFHAKFRPEFSGKKCIKTQGKDVDINRLDWEDPLKTRHRFIEMGVARNCVDVMQGNSGEQFDQVVRRCLGSSSLPQPLLDDWKRIAQLRNPPSHTELLSRDGFFEVANKVLKTENLETLLKIKRTLSH